MPSYTLSFSSEQDVALQALATSEGYKSAQSYLDTVTGELLAQRARGADDALVAKARSGGSLTGGEKARVRAVLNLA